MEYVCRLWRGYGGGPAMLAFIWDDLTMDEGWAYHAWLMDNDAWLQFGGVSRSSKGYISQEIEKLMGQAKKQYGG